VTLHGTGRAGGALTVVNAIPVGRGAAGGLDLETRARVEVQRQAGPVEVQVEDHPDADPSLAEACVAAVADHAGTPLGGRVETTSEIPIARGLKSSSAAANAVVLALLDALDREPEPRTVLEIGVEAARRAGVTKTGALDDAAASLLGGLVVTDNREDRVERREPLNTDHAVVLLVPQRRQPTASVEGLEDARPVAQRSLALVDEGAWRHALTLNGLGVAASTGQGLDPAYRALGNGATAAGTTGTGPAVGAVCPPDATALVRRAWEPYTGRGDGLLEAATTDEGVHA
jgi:shikimate kinase